MVSQTGEMVMPTNLKNDLIAILLQDIKVHIVGITLPHGFVFIPCPRRYMHQEDVLPIILLCKDILQPEHLLDTGSRCILKLPITIVVESIQGQHCDFVCQVKSVVATFLECVLYSFLL